MIVPRAAASFDPGPRWAGGLAIVSTVVILAGAVVAGAAYAGPAGEPYSPLNHFISELGELAQSRLGAVYDAGIILGGLGLGVFLAVLARHLTGRFRPAMRIAAVLAAASGILTGLLPMDTQQIHEIVSGVFFVSAWSVAAVFSAWLAGGPRPGFPRWLLVPGLGCVPFFVAFVVDYLNYHRADQYAPILDRPTVWTVPLFEWAALLTLLAWFVAVGAVLLSHRSWPDA